MVCYNSNFFLKFVQNGEKLIFPDNCGLGVINAKSEEFSTLGNVTSSETINIKENSIFCGACKPGYKPTFKNERNQSLVV